MNKFKFYFFTFFYLILNTAYGAEYGIGVGVNNYNYYLYLPINKDEYRVEPMVNYSDYSTTYDNTYSKYYGLGLGIFKVLSQSSNTKLYFGPRITYGVSEGNSSGYVQTKEYALSPTLGFEYYLAENISLGGEAYFSFSKSDSTNTTVVKAKSTGTMVTMKYYFK